MSQTQTTDQVADLKEAIEAALANDPKVRGMLSQEPYVSWNHQWNVNWVHGNTKPSVELGKCRRVCPLVK